MTSIENNNEDFQEIRSRVDSIANAVFLIAGGALSLSISVILSNKSAGIVTPQVACLAICAWYTLLASVLLFLLLKGYLILQAYMLQFHTEFVNKHLAALNRVGWGIGLVGFVAFVVGLVLMVRAAATAVGVS